MSLYFGHIPDRLVDAEHDGRTRHIGGLIGSGLTVPESVDHSRHLDFVPDQGRTNRCVGWFTSSAIYLTGQTLGQPVKRPSAKWAYDVARYFDTPSVLVDVGCRPRSMMLGLERHGIVAEERLASTESNVNEHPPFDADIAGGDALFSGYYKVEGDVPALLRSALAKGHIPGFAMVVHESFTDIRSGVYDQPDGAELGRHMVTLVGYRPGAFLLLNSWGTGWGDSGFCWVSDRFVASHFVSDRYVVTAAPRST